MSQTHIVPLPTQAPSRPRTHLPFTADGSMPLSPETMHTLDEVMKRHFTLRSAPMNATIFGIWWTFRNLIRLAQAADDRLYPEWRNTPVEKPVFIFATARSGTTMLHRLLSLDESRWATVKLYQTVFPTVTAERVFETLRDSRLARVVPELLNATAFSGWRGVHEFDVTGAEEDEALFVYMGSSFTLTLLLPYAEEIANTFEFDRLDPKTREAMLDFYEASLRRFLHASGHGRRLLNKNVFTGPRLRSLATRFEDSQFVFLVRHPYESLGSYLSMWHRAWAIHRPEVKKNSPESRSFARLALAHYRDALAERANLSANRMLVVRYEDLAKDPERTVIRLYDDLGETVSPEFARELHAATVAQREYKSEHSYALEEYGITRDWLYQQIPDVYREFGFEP